LRVQGFSTSFCSCDLDLDPITFIYELDLYSHAGGIPNMYVDVFDSYRLTDRQTDRQTDTTKITPRRFTDSQLQSVCVTCCMLTSTLVCFFSVNRPSLASITISTASFLQLCYSQSYYVSLMLQHCGESISNTLQALPNFYYVSFPYQLNSI